MKYHNIWNIRRLKICRLKICRHDLWLLAGHRPAIQCFEENDISHIVYTDLSLTVKIKLMCQFHRHNTPHILTNVRDAMDLLPDTLNWGLRKRRECRERFPRHYGLAIPPCITARA